VERGEPLHERRHVDDQVGHDREVRHRLDRHAPGIEVGEMRDAGEALATVHANTAGAARRVQAGVSDGERRVAVDLDPSERVQHRAPRSHLRLEQLVPGRSAVTFESEDAEGSCAHGGGREIGRAAGTWLEHDHHAAK
jgi:hypothetical protein